MKWSFLNGFPFETRFPKILDFNVISLFTFCPFSIIFPFFRIFLLILILIIFVPHFYWNKYSFTECFGLLSSISRPFPSIIFIFIKIIIIQWFLKIFFFFSLSIQNFVSLFIMENVFFYRLFLFFQVPDNLLLYYLN